ncbi:hypothetical protein BAVI_05249 [Neobacillus vireti LMG 21834]|uniref:Uncharacterized protein n=1 Tax=Neobacillus vireti LMG 21834 TaxID=1131730 RepID=A0AB94IS60_9BACI|nr:hypothetical protein BAVI_05249 [Neobacillus vireti LMG 21834]KLT18162.1 hypothetical protein AA980_07370 [Neobacillus vireti]
MTDTFILLKKGTISGDWTVGSGFGFGFGSGGIPQNRLPGGPPEEPFSWLSVDSYRRAIYLAIKTPEPSTFRKGF